MQIYPFEYIIVWCVVRIHPDRLDNGQGLLKTLQRLELHNQYNLITLLRSWKGRWRHRTAVHTSVMLTSCDFFPPKQACLDYICTFWLRYTGRIHVMYSEGKLPPWENMSRYDHCCKYSKGVPLAMPPRFCKACEQTEQLDMHLSSTCLQWCNYPQGMVVCFFTFSKTGAIRSHWSVQRMQLQYAVRITDLQ